MWCSRRAWACVVTLAGCASEELTMDRPLLPGDRVLVISRADEPSAIAALIEVGADARVSVARSQDERIAFAILPGASVRDASGGDPRWDAVQVVLDGDDGPCGCRGTPLSDGLQVTGPGDRCPLSALTALEVTPEGTDDSALIASLRERVRLVWPGACACMQEPLATDTRVEVCPIGEGAERQRVDALSMAEDGTIVARSRGLLSYLTPDGPTREQPLMPAIEWPSQIELRPDGDGFLLSEVHATLRRTTDLRFLPRRGDSPAVPLAGVPHDMTVEGVTWDEDASRLWMYGRTGNDVSRRPSYATCTLDPSGTSVACDARTLPRDSQCPQHFAEAPMVLDAALEAGNRMWLTLAGAPVFWSGARSNVVCAPDAQSITVRLPAGGRVGAQPYALSMLGRRAVVCAINPYVIDPVVAVVVATVEPFDATTTPQLRWTTVSARQGGALNCARAFRDPARPGRIFQPIGWGEHQTIVELSETGTTAIEHESAQALYPGLDPGWTHFASASGHLAARTLSGEIRSIEGGVVRPRATLDGLGAARDVRVQAIASTALGRFEVDLGGAAPVSVTVGGREGCDDVERTVPAVALDVQRTVSAVGPWGEELVRAVSDDDGHALEFGADTSRRVSLLAEATRVRELIPGRWALVLDADHEVYATNARALVPVGIGAQWSDLDAKDGVAWVGGGPSVLRILMPQDGDFRSQEVLTRQMRATIEARHGVDGYVVTAVRALCGGRVMIAVRGEPFDNDGDVTLWTAEPRGGAFVLTEYLGFGDPEHLRGQAGQAIAAVAGLERAPVVILGADPYGVSAGLFVGGAPFAALPFGQPSAVMSSGADVLVGGANGRMALIRVR